jgi:hypothetical protein
MQTAFKRFEETVATRGPEPKLPSSVDREDFYLHVSASTIEGHVSLAGAGCVDYPRSKGGRAAHFFDWLKSQSYTLPKSFEEAHSSEIWSREVARSYLDDCFSQMKEATRIGKPIRMRHSVIAELGKARVITLLPGYAVQGLVALQKVLLGYLEGIPQVKDGVFFRDDAYRAYASVPRGTQGFVLSDLSEATDHPSRMIIPKMLDILVTHALKVSEKGWTPIIDDEIIEKIRVARDFLLLDRFLELKGGRTIPILRGALMGDPCTKVVLTLAMYVILKETFPDRWFRIKGDDLVIASSHASASEDLQSLRTAMEEAGFLLSEVDTYFSTVAFYCEGIFKVPLSSAQTEAFARKHRVNYQCADPPKGRYLVPFFKRGDNSQRKDPLVLPETKLGQLAKHCQWFRRHTVEWQKTASAALTSVYSLRLHKDILVNVPQSHGGMGLDPTIFGWESNLWYWTEFDRLKLTEVSRVCPSKPTGVDIPRFVARKQNHSFSHRLRLEPSDIIPKEWRDLKISLGRISKEYPIEISSILERMPGYVSEQGLASYVQSTEDFLSKFLGIAREKKESKAPRSSFLERCLKLESTPVPQAIKDCVKRFYSKNLKVTSLTFYPGELIPERLVWKDPTRRIFKKIPKSPEDFVMELEPGLCPDADLIKQVLEDPDTGTFLIGTADRALVESIYKRLRKIRRSQCLIQVEALLFDCPQTAEDLLELLTSDYHIGCSEGDSHEVRIRKRIFGSISPPIIFMMDSGFLEKSKLSLFFTEEGVILNHPATSDECRGEHMLAG